MSQDALSALATAISDQARAVDMLVVPVTPGEDGGFAVELTSEHMTAKDFLALAGAAGARMFYIETTPLDPDDLFDGLDEDEFDEDVWGQLDGFRAEAAARTDQVSQVELAFVAGSVLHLWSVQADWVTDLANRIRALVPEIVVESRSRAEVDVEGLATRLADSAEFRAVRFQARTTAAIDLLAELRALEEAEGPRAYEVRQVVTRAGEIIEERRTAIYNQLRPTFPDLALLLAKDPDWVNGGVISLRREAVDQFLAQHADGYLPTTLDRDRIMNLTPVGKRRKNPVQGPPDSVFD
ncbi:hypothetical protein [Longispora fulva]|uniref:Uncharacterized protein n=1 Tax=Longispora fulva TaxID=619741 RepID=A0A8J7G579_9ACTN|nr:hypothetical protein [Longispora fulva]MBG6133893.1 hypothetical protein [Longispora fulva]